MAWRERWLAVILARSFTACLSGRSGREHVGDQTRQNLQRRDARGFVDLVHREEQIAPTPPLPQQAGGFDEFTNHLGRKERDQLELFITVSLRQLIPEEHVLAQVDRLLDLTPLRDEVTD
jgi:hypothetical protein